MVKTLLVLVVCIFESLGYLSAHFISLDQAYAKRKKYLPLSVLQTYTITTRSDHVGYPIDWNAQFQKLLAFPEDTEVQKLEKYELLSALSKVLPRGSVYKAN